MKVTGAYRYLNRNWIAAGSGEGSSPLSYHCVRCGHRTTVSLPSFERAVEECRETSQRELSQALRQACAVPPRVDAVCPIRCDGCGRLVLLGFWVRKSPPREVSYQLTCIGVEED